MRPTIFTFALVIFTMLTAWSSKAESKGQAQVFDVSYETATNKLSELKLNPAAAKSQISIPGHELESGRTYEFFLPETEQGDVSGTYTTIAATKIDSKSTRVEIKTIKLGIIFNSRDRQIEKQRLNELSQLLSNKN